MAVKISKNGIGFGGVVRWTTLYSAIAFALVSGYNWKISVDLYIAESRAARKSMVETLDGITLRIDRMFLARAGGYNLPIPTARSTP